jgi:hypothetical protein
MDNVKSAELLANRGGIRTPAQPSGNPSPVAHLAVD